MKIKTSKNGKKFCVVSISKPADGDIVFLTHKEFEWILKQNFKNNEFDFIHQAKIENYTYRIIPEDEVKESIKIAQKYSREIIDKLKGGTNGSTGEGQNHEPQANTREQ